MSMYTALIPQTSKMLRNLSRCLDKAVAHAAEKNFDVERLLTSRLAPDHYSLSRHVQAACDMAKMGAARLSGTEGPVDEDGELPLDALRARIERTEKFVNSIRPEQFEQAPLREIAPPFLKGKALRGADYMNEFILPNFYFHITCVYALLRQSGVPLSKQEYIGSLNSYEPEKP